MAALISCVVGYVFGVFFIENCPVIGEQYE